MCRSRPVGGAAYPDDIAASTRSWSDPEGGPALSSTSACVLRAQGLGLWHPPLNLRHVVDLEVDDLDRIVVSEHDVHGEMCDQHACRNQYTDIRHAGDFEGGVFVVLRKEVDEWRELMEEEIGRGGDPAGTPLLAGCSEFGQGRVPGRAGWSGRVGG